MGNKTPELTYHTDIKAEISADDGWTIIRVYLEHFDTDGNESLCVDTPDGKVYLDKGVIPAVLRAIEEVARGLE